MDTAKKDQETGMPATAAQDSVSFEQALENWEQEMQDVTDADRAAEQLSAEDLAIRINTKA